MNIYSLFSVIAGLLFAISFIPYIKSILQRKTQPTKASWLIWACLDSITIAGMYSEHTLNGQIITAVIGAWTVTILALKYGVPGWNKIDKICLAAALLGIILWIAFHNASFGIVISVTAMIIGSIPTFTSAWHDPSREDKTAWTIFMLSCIAALLSVSIWTFAYAAQPIAFTIINTIMLWILYFHRPIVSPQ